VPQDRGANTLGCYGLQLASSLGNLGGLHIDEEDRKLFKLPRTVLLSNQRQLSRASTTLKESVDKAARDFERNSPSKIKNKVKYDEDGNEIRPSSPYPDSILREPIRSEKFETRLSDHAEV
jgi:hypothetical protein